METVEFLGVSLRGGDVLKPAKQVIGQWDGESFENTYLWLR